MNNTTTDDQSANNPFTDHPLLDIENSLQDLDAAARLLGHIKGTPLQIGAAELHAVQGMVEKAHDDIEQHWDAAYERQLADAAVHKAALEAALAERGAPGSADDIRRAKAMWNVLRALANAALDACDEAMPAEAEAHENGAE